MLKDWKCKIKDNFEELEFSQHPLRRKIASGPRSATLFYLFFLVTHPCIFFKFYFICTYHKSFYVSKILQKVFFSATNCYIKNVAHKIANRGTQNKLSIIRFCSLKRTLYNRRLPSYKFRNVRTIAFLNEVERIQSKIHIPAVSNCVGAWIISHAHAVWIPLRILIFCLPLHGSDFSVVAENIIAEKTS